MKYVTITFDDGRSDNYVYANPILRKYKIPATLFVTTGFVDGTWTKPTDQWKSVSGALSITELQEMASHGWELGLHGDKHITDLKDLENAYKKFVEWGFVDDKIPFSIPNSEKIEDELYRIESSSLGNLISFIREGRGIDTKQLKYRVLYLLYNYCNAQWAYDKFNQPSCNGVSYTTASKRVYSVVVKRNDSPKMICKFLRQIPDNSWVIFMLHSILPQEDKLYLADEWTWSTTNFERFISQMAKYQDASLITLASFKMMEGLMNERDKE